MKLFSLTKVINIAFQYVIQTSHLLRIDESHSLRHSIEVFEYASRILKDELRAKPFLEEEKPVILCSAILHDMCDKKYMDEKRGIANMNQYMKPYLSYDQLNSINTIISTMSYSTIQKNGYPTLEDPLLSAYHIVREADLLAAYDVDRCLIYQMEHEKTSYTESIQYVKDLFDNRVLTYIPNGLFINEYSKRKAQRLHDSAIAKIKKYDDIYSICSEVKDRII